MKGSPIHVISSEARNLALKVETVQGSIGCVVPLHRELAIGTLHGILQQAKVPAEEFMKEL